MTRLRGKHLPGKSNAPPLLYWVRSTVQSHETNIKGVQKLTRKLPKESIAQIVTQISSMQLNFLPEVDESDDVDECECDADEDEEAAAEVG